MTFKFASRVAAIALALNGFAALSCQAAVPGAEKLLPDDTLAMICAPDFAKARADWTNTPTSRLWSDPAMKPFKDKFMDRLNSEYIAPLERELGVQLGDFMGLPQGQVTVALVSDGWSGSPLEEKSPAWLLLADAKDKAPLLRTNLDNLKKKWIDSGKTIRTEKIRDVEFSVAMLSSNDIPKTLQKIFQTASNAAPAFVDPLAKKPATPEVYIGQVDSLLIAGSSPKTIEKTLVALGGGTIKTLGDCPAYDATQAAPLQKGDIYGWVNARAWVSAFGHYNDNVKELEPEKNPFSFQPGKIITTTGLDGVKGLYFNYAIGDDGVRANVFLTAPESARQGIFKILAGEAKDCLPPAFVPENAVTFSRWRINGSQSWATLRKMISSNIPAADGALDLIISSAEAYTKEKDPDFDLKKYLFENIGDDFIVYRKLTGGDAQGNGAAPSALFLTASPHPELMVAAVKSLLVLIVPQSEAPTEREFLGHKIYTIKITPPQLPGEAKLPAQNLCFAAGNGFVAASADAGMLEDFLRASGDQGKPLKDRAGLTDAAQAAAVGGASAFGYSNGAELTRASLARLKNDPAAEGELGNLVPFWVSAIAGGDMRRYKDWFDTSLLPPYDAVGKYFSFSVFSSSPSPDGISFKYFAPTPPQLKK